LSDDSLDLAALPPSWEIHLRAQRKSASTVNVYAGGVRDRADAGPAHRATHIADMLDSGAEAAAACQLALCRFAAWLVEEGELDANPLAGLKPVRVDSKVVPVLTEQQLRELLVACQGKSLRDRRDEALVRLLAETCLRAGEAVVLELSDAGWYRRTKP
jgi:integrase/recombinase XerD